MAHRKTASKSGGNGRDSKRSTKTKKRAAARSTRSGSSRRPGVANAKPAAEEEVSIDRRRTDRRDLEDASDGRAGVAGSPLERRKKVNRRRQIDPTTCERDYTDDEVQFMNALDDYKRTSGRMFPTCSEVLEVVRGLGYVKVPAAEFAALRGAGSSDESATAIPGDWTDADATGDGDLQGSDDSSALADTPELAC